MATSLVIALSALCALAGAFVGGALQRSRVLRVASRARLDCDERQAERDDAARDLHDELLQGTQGLVLNFQVIATELPPDDPRRRRMEAVLDQADHVLADNRAKARGLRSRPEPEPSLFDSLRAIGQELAAARAASFAATQVGRRVALRPEAAEEAYLLGWEALRQAFQHRRARRVELVLSFETRRLRLLVRDDGSGPDDVAPSTVGRPDLPGGAGMNARARRLGARLSIRGDPRRGTEVSLVVPARRVFRDARATGRWRDFFGADC